MLNIQFIEGKCLTFPFLLNEEEYVTDFQPLKLQQQALDDIARADSPVVLENVRVNYLGKKGLLTQELKKIGQLDPRQRREAGQQVNQVKQVVQQSLDTRKEQLQKQDEQNRLAGEMIDVTLPGRGQAVFS